MSRTIPPTDPTATTSHTRHAVRAARTYSCTQRWLFSQFKSVGGGARIEREWSNRIVSASASESLPPCVKGFASGFMPGIVRDMDVAHEAYRDVFTAVPGMNPEAEPKHGLIATRTR